MKRLYKEMIFFVFLSYVGITPCFASDSTNVAVPNITIGAPLTYYYTYYANTAGWYCNECWSSWVFNLYSTGGGGISATTPLPAGTYKCTLYFIANSANSAGRWVQLNNVRVTANSNTTTLLQTGYLGFGCDSCFPYIYSNTYTSTFTTNQPITPQISIDIRDSSHNEAWWVFTGSATFTPM